MVDIALCLEFLAPGVAYRGGTSDNTKDAYDRIVWLSDKVKKPSWAEIEAVDAEARAAYDAVKPIPVEDRISKLEADMTAVKSEAAK